MNWGLLRGFEPNWLDYHYSRDDRSQHKNQNKHKPMEEHERRNQLVQCYQRQEQTHNDMF